MPPFIQKHRDCKCQLGDTYRFLPSLQAEGGIEVRQRLKFRQRPGLVAGEYNEMIKRKSIEIHCCMLLGTRSFPQISDVRPDMRQRELLVTSRAACCWNRMLLSR